MSVPYTVTEVGGLSSTDTPYSITAVSDAEQTTFAAAVASTACHGMTVAFVRGEFNSASSSWTGHLYYYDENSNFMGSSALITLTASATRTNATKFIADLSTNVIPGASSIRPYTVSLTLGETVRLFIGKQE